MTHNCLSFMRDLQQKNLNELEKWFTDESTVWIPPINPMKGKRKIIVLFRAIFSKYNQLNWHVKQVHQIEDRRCIFHTESWGEFKNGTPYKNYIVTDISFNDKDEIIDLSDYFKYTFNFSG